MDMADYYGEMGSIEQDYFEQLEEAKMHDPTVELTERDERDWQDERQEEIAAICWQKCPACNGRGYDRQRWPADDGGPEYLLRPSCPECAADGHIQLHDPQRVEALYAAADDARERMGVWCYTRIASALALAINGGVTFIEDRGATVESQTIENKFYTVPCGQGCNCYDAFLRAPKIDGIPHCKHQIAVWLVKAAEKRMETAK